MNQPRPPRYPWLFCLGLLASVAAWAPHAPSAAAPATAPADGLRDNTPRVQALTQVRIVVAPGQVIERGTLVIRDGVIEAVGAEIAPPKDAVIRDLSGKTLYAGLLDAYSELSAEASRAGLSERQGAGHWNSRIVPQATTEDRYTPDVEHNKKLRSQGITTRLLAPSHGIVKGTSAIVATGDESGSRAILKHSVAMHLALTPSHGEEAYPTSPMGAMTLVRQVFYDAGWYAQAWQAYQQQPGLSRPERNDALAALQPCLGGKLPVVIDAADELYFLRAQQVATEFGLDLIVRGSGREYRRLDAIRATGRPVIVPVNFAQAPRVGTPESAQSVPLEKLLHWDIAPENPARLEAAGVKFAFTTRGLPDVGGFLAAVRKAVERGLPADAALRAMTVTPATLFGVSDKLGTLEVGKVANLIVTDGDLFHKQTKILETLVDGRRYTQETAPHADLRGTWQLQVTRPDNGTETIELKLEGQPTQLSGKAVRAGKETPLTAVSLDGAQFGATFKGDDLGLPGVVQVSGTLSSVADPAAALTWLGFIVWPDGARTACQAQRTAPFQPPAVAETPAENRAALFAVNYPLGAFGVSGPPAQPKAVLFQHATIWTCGAAGVLEDASLLIQDGKIVAAGKDLAAPPDAVVIDATGKHITPGIIDCHSHIATDGGVNEVGQTITAEVRIGDFIDPDDVNIYRQLAGGVTCSNILHGSANTIGGQCQALKFRWGALPEEMKLAGAPPSIKFALGENPKQSNWGDNHTSRYPQTRMGVEQLVRDAFRAAQDYSRQWEAWRAKNQGLPPRTDLELEALAEVLAGKRHIHCHSYRQDEILAFLRTCEHFGVRVATLQHILEGYKLADVIAKHGAGGSSFSDWWAYKFEVYDAIPYNGALMHRAGVVVSFNSDDAELGRRLNLEAAKAVKYGGVPEAEALQFVTLNPARQMGVEAQVGSLEAGKDADLVVWSGRPMSTYSRCEQTWVDGRKYFDRQEDSARRAEANRMRAALVQRVLISGEPMESPNDGQKSLWAREDVYCHDHGDDHE